MTHGEKQGLAALATVLALVLGAIWLSNRSTPHGHLQEVALPEATESAGDTILKADTTDTPPAVGRTPSAKPHRRTATLPDRTSPLDSPTPDAR